MTTIFAISIITFLVFGISLKVLNRFAKDGDNVLSAIHITVVALSIVTVILAVTN